MITFAELLLTCLVLWIIYRYVISSKEKAPAVGVSTGRSSGRHSAYQHRGWIALALILAVCLPMPVILRLMLVGGTIVLLIVVCAAIGRPRQTSSVATSGDPPRPAPKPAKLRRFERVKPIEPEYPESRSGSDWFGSMVRVFATLVLLAIGAAFVSESGPHRRDHSVSFADAPSNRPATTVEDAAVPISAKSTDAENVFYPEEILMLPADGVSKVTLISDARVDPFEADASLRKRITEFMRVAVEDTFDADADGWNPPTSWLEKVANQSYEMQESANGVVLTVKKATIDLSDESLREYHRRFHEDKRSQRTVRAAQAYAGTVLILGGLAIFLRLGTSRRPKRA